MEELQQHQGEWFFLHELNVDKVFSTIQRADYLILYYIKVEQEAHPGEKIYLADLAAAMGLRVTELSKGIEKLQDSGFVTWKTDREAGRTYVELSSKAVELMAEEQALLQRCYRRMRAELGDEELRRAAATDVSEADFADPLDRLSIYYCLSRPVAELFYAQFGEEAFPLAAAFYEKPKTTIRVNTLRTNDTDLTALLQQEGHTVTPGPWPGALVVEFAGSPAASAAFKKGLFHVQGLASQFAALCVDAQPGQQVLDLCAAPGGKSLTLAEAMQDKGQLVSGEFVPARVPLLQQAFDRCGITCAVAVENDATQHNSDWPTFDRVLCDVPCSGLGVIAKKPDIRYKDLDGIENLLAAQQKILQNGADSLAENTGTINYETVCLVGKRVPRIYIKDGKIENVMYKL